MNKENKIELIEATEVLATNDEFISQELKKFNIADATIEQWKQEYGSLIISSISDKENYDKVYTARNFVRKKRVEVEKTGKELRSGAIKFQKAVINEEKRLVELIDPLESHLESELKKIDNEKARIKLERDTLEQRQLQERSVKLVQYGMSLIGDNYILEDINISTIEVKGDNNFVWSGKLAQVEAIFKNKEEHRLAEEARVKLVLEEQRAKEEELRLKEEAITARQKILEEAEAKAKLEEEHRKKVEEERIKKEQEEKEDATKKAIEDRLKLRKSALFQLGFSQTHEKLIFQDQSILDSTLQSITDELWPSYIEVTTSTITAIKTKLEQERLEREEKLKKEIEDKAKEKLLKEQEEAKIKADNERIAQEKESQRIAALRPDSEKIIEFLTTISKLKVPECATDIMQRYCEDFRISRNLWLKQMFEKMPK